MSDPAIRIAMWSGPRNISTAMMRSFGARPDTLVADEPFYAAYLAATGLDHPMRAEVIAAGETDPQKVATSLLAPLPEGKSVFYQKHMTHHMTPDMPRGWIARVANAFLIREPERVLASYVARREAVSLADIGFEAQGEIFEAVCRETGEVPPVVAAEDVRANPHKVLGALCARLGIAFSDAMLSWQPGLHPSDGVWARHWYESVAKSTSFAPADAHAPLPVLPPHLQRIADAARPFYERLAAHRIAA